MLIVILLFLLLLSSFFFFCRTGTGLFTVWRTWKKEGTPVDVRVRCCVVHGIIAVFIPTVFTHDIAVGHAFPSLQPAV